MRSSAPLRFISAVALVIFVAFAGLAQTPGKVDPKLLKEIDDVELRIKKLQDQLKSIKEGIKPEPTKPTVDAAPANLGKLFAWRPIGPANMGGRITSLAVFPGDPACY